MDFAVLADHRVKKKKIVKRLTNTLIFSELKSLCNMKLIVIRILVVVFGTVPKVLEKRLKEIG